MGFFLLYFSGILLRFLIKMFMVFKRVITVHATEVIDEHHRTHPHERHGLRK